MGDENFKCLIFTPKCIELNSESKPQIDFGFRSRPRSNICFFLAECLLEIEIFVSVKN